MQHKVKRLRFVSIRHTPEVKLSHLSLGRTSKNLTDDSIPNKFPIWKQLTCEGEVYRWKWRWPSVEAGEASDPANLPDFVVSSPTGSLSPLCSLFSSSPLSPSFLTPLVISLIRIIHCRVWATHICRGRFWLCNRIH